ncbi:DUF732 domain-containing protein [Mycolicibacterium sp. J2]|jgi:hypothetical protein|uniref:DUF732 domain-containing protein n=1 Tax=Mycolicibacterium sp. J2 TaxID=2993511 RepID=UPI00224A4D24|nr:DUF732 domain-containing protein [Mycolicibacterium sp. J2]MCX2714481.1 DUF732 domain-containing protein [Mycolicibacterium sp. J2]
MLSTAARAAVVTTLSGLALGLAVLSSAGTANAITSQTDSAFLDEIAKEGIAYDSATDVIGNARQVCSKLKAGATGTEIGMDILANTDLTTRQAAAFVVMSIDYYCPQYTDAFA